MDLEERIMELSRYGYACGQILAILLLDTVGEENPKLTQCMQGLNCGIGGKRGRLRLHGGGKLSDRLLYG